MRGRKIIAPGTLMTIRLYDRLRATLHNFPEVPVLVADEIAREIDEEPDTNASPPPESYGIVAPPFQEFFVEADTILHGELIQRGVLVSDVTEQWRKRTIIPRNHPNFHEFYSSHPESRWVLRLRGWVRRLMEIHEYNAMAFLHLNDRGHLLDNTETITIVQVAESNQTRVQIHANAFAANIPFVLRAINGLHRRIVVDRVTPPRALRRLAQREDVQELHEYYVLRVKTTPLAKELDEIETIDVRPKDDEVSPKRRRHIVRGHFRYYHPSRPLFGRVSGMVWIDEHERGSATLGFIEKDYEIR